MGIYLNTKASLLKYCNDFKTRHDFALDVFDLDSHASVNELPAEDLIGVAEYSIENDAGLYTATCQIFVSTQADDQNLKRLSPIIDKLFDELQVDTILQIVTASEGEDYGKLKVYNSVVVFPVARNAKARPLQSLGLQVAVTFPDSVL